MGCGARNGEVDEDGPSQAIAFAAGGIRVRRCDIGHAPRAVFSRGLRLPLTTAAQHSHTQLSSTTHGTTGAGAGPAGPATAAGRAGNARKYQARGNRSMNRRPSAIGCVHR